MYRLFFIALLVSLQACISVGSTFEGRGEVAIISEISTDIEDNLLTIDVSADQEIEFISYKLKSPTRLAVELQNISKGQIEDRIELDSKFASEIRIQSFRNSNIVRMEIKIENDFNYDIKSVDNSISIKIRKLPNRLAISSRTPTGNKTVDRAKSDKIEQFLQYWIKGWESRDIDHYVSFYDASFNTDGITINKWKSKKTRLFTVSKSIEVSISNIQISYFANHIVVSFLQKYRSDQNSDEGI
ncbi:MAG: AMIN domain-containing protein, partial [Nitrospinota bacterium]